MIIKPKKFTIPRAKWLHGEGGERSKLLRESDGKMCCLGVYCLAAGFSANDINEVPAPACLNMDHHEELIACGLEEGLEEEERDIVRLVDQLMEANDQNGMSDGDRESKITELFKEMGVEVRFED